MNIGFIGLGNMGSGMAANLLGYCRQYGHRLYLMDVNQDALLPLLERGAVAASSVDRLAADVQVLFTSLPSAVEINSIADDILQNLPADAVWFETSTNRLADWQLLIAKAPDNISMVDAPVTGGAEGAAAGSLTMLLGIEEQLLVEHAPLLASFTAKAVRMGPSGAGYVAKLCQLHLNYLAAQGIGEALMLGARAKLDLAKLYTVLQASCAQSYVVDNYVPKVLDGSYDPSFTLGLATKDMRLISELGEHLDVPLPLAEKVYQSYLAASETYGAGEPHLKIVKLLEDLSKTPLRAD